MRSSLPAVYKYTDYRPIAQIGNGIRRIFYTESRFSIGLQAMEYLAVPYEPVWRVCILPPSDESPEMWEFVERSNDEPRKRSRVWAAFGKHGGGWEIVTRSVFRPTCPLYLPSEAQNGINVSFQSPDNYWLMDRPMCSNGYVDDYCEFVRGEDTEHGGIPDLIKRVIVSARSRSTFGDGFEGDEIYGDKIPDDVLGGVLHGKYKDIEYSISFLIRAECELLACYKLWGMLWNDKIIPGTRNYLEVACNEIISPLPLPSSNNDEIVSYLSDLITCLRLQLLNYIRRGITWLHVIRLPNEV